MHLKEKLWQTNGYCFLNEGTLLTIQWAFDAFDGTNRETITFLKMHGHMLNYIDNPEEYKRIRDYAETLDMPKWPEEGSIIYEDGIVIVNL